MDVFENLREFAHTFTAGLADTTHWRAALQPVLALGTAIWLGLRGARRTGLHRSFRTEPFRWLGYRDLVNQTLSVFIAGVALDLLLQNQGQPAASNFVQAAVMAITLACAPFLFLRVGFSRIARVAFRRKRFRR